MIKYRKWDKNDTKYIQEKKEDKGARRRNLFLN
jgi:hypothetical protein